MFSKKRLEVKDTDFYINKPGIFEKAFGEYLNVIAFKTSNPIIRVFENGVLRKSFLIETLSKNPDLTGQYFHSSVRVLENGAVMIDGIISKNKDKLAESSNNDFEGIRFQPFFLLSMAEEKNNQLIGKGLFDRGLHYSGYVTASNIRVICICDECQKSFSVEHFHAGFSETQYYYSNDSKQTLIVPYTQIPNQPAHLQTDIDEETLAEVESKLPKPNIGTGKFKYYNSFRCPHCLSPFIDFQNNKYLRPNEYYGNKYINEKFYRLEDFQ